MRSRVNRRSSIFAQSKLANAYLSAEAFPSSPLQAGTRKSNGFNRLEGSRLIGWEIELSPRRVMAKLLNRDKSITLVEVSQALSNVKYIELLSELDRSRIFIMANFGRL